MENDKPLVPWRYADRTWPEVNDEIPQRKVLLLPIGSTEDHGPHLPLDTDFFIPTCLAERAASRRPDLMTVMPTIPYGFNLHHIDYPGTIHVASQHFIDYVLDVVKSVAYHGFKKVLLLDGHGSNMPGLDIVARRAILETDAHCAVVIWTSLAMETFHDLRQTPFPGVAHAEELETSVYMHLGPGRVRTDRMAAEFPSVYENQFVWQDLERAAPVQMMDWWSRFGTTGIVGDATLASAEKGRVVAEAVVEKLIEFAQWFRELPIESRRDFHRGPTGAVHLDS